ncbi:MAG: hypothetical protein ACP5I2_07725, partial [Fervidicoccaceae archaeon]
YFLWIDGRSILSVNSPSIYSSSTYPEISSFSDLQTDGSMHSGYRFSQFASLSEDAGGFFLFRREIPLHPEERGRGGG